MRLILSITWKFFLPATFFTLSVTFAAPSEQRLNPDAPEWRALVERFANQPDVVATFEEQRTFPFRNEPLVLKGEVRVSRQRGLSLRYTSPEERMVIIDEKGVLLREATGDKTPPADPRANAANDVMFHVLRLNVAGLEKSFEVYGTQGADEWALRLVPREEGVRRALGEIHVAGEGASVRRIELWRSAKQHIDIVISSPREIGMFSADEVKRFFR